MSHKHHGGHGEGIFTIYMTIATVLAICTALSFVFNYLAHEDVAAISLFTAFALILGVAIIKATLVGTYFMHLKWDWRTLYFIIVPVSILSITMVIAMLPDILIGTYKDASEDYAIAQEFALKVAPHKK